MTSPQPLVARPVDGAADSAALFAGVDGTAEAAFWLDAGPDASDGWSILGMGHRETDADAVMRTVVGGNSAADSALPFHGGWVGWLEYEADRRCWIAVERAIAIDHATQRVWALAPASDLDVWHADVTDLVATAQPLPPPPPPETATAIARHSADDYGALVERCRAAIKAGDAYLLCLTTRFTTTAPQDPFAAYRRLRAATPAHHGGYLRIGGRHLLSASPEQFLHVGGGMARTSPIKGTRPRGATAQQDAALADELRTSRKERAENVMIVDLMRNDLSHVGVPGTVSVERLWQVESYPAVHQLVSTVSVRLQPGVTFGELCEAAFPAGSMTGAPKLSAMTILRELEQGPRGVYSGCFGHVGLDGSADLGMVIRSIVVDAGEAYVGAGGGITWLSDAAEETAEVATKARAPLAAIGAEPPADWQRASTGS